MEDHGRFATTNNQDAKTTPLTQFLVSICAATLLGMSMVLSPQHLSNVNPTLG